MMTNDAIKAISELDLEPIKMKLMHVESGEGWSLEKAEAVEVEYRRFLYLMKAFPEEETSPLVEVDIFWHYHILDTMKYAKDCEQAFGYFLHHYPYVGMSGAHDDAQVLQAGADRMRDLYEQVFDEPYGQRAAAWCAKAPATALESAWCARAPAAALESAWCARAPAAALESAWCARAPAAALESAWCARAPAAALESAWCAKAPAAALESAWCARAPAAALESAWCAKAPAAAHKAAWCAKAPAAAHKAAPAALQSAWCVKGTSAALQSAWCVKGSSAAQKSAWCVKTRASSVGAAASSTVEPPAPADAMRVSAATAALIQSIAHGNPQPA
ncbi:hypothetical protein PO883_21755 [Massilia sp. DJPM01]|uniref:glycine-rich domain-containing protein n=1 Tax=Massilia sp. DJPM01 TaxID=3024404 RepID=UPI00259E3B06|nr:hypothetical protein [Massilia sp. DJPM01]MDM5179819.1 hypothetical protein [Massilia sp. DJPM01]